MSLSDRVFVCEECGHTEDRDLNASKNIAEAPEQMYEPLA
jgi:putative transposase